MDKEHREKLLSDIIDVVPNPDIQFFIQMTVDTMEKLKSDGALRQDETPEDGLLRNIVGAVTTITSIAVNDAVLLYSATKNGFLNKKMGIAYTDMLQELKEIQDKFHYKLMNEIKDNMGLDKDKL